MTKQITKAEVEASTEWFLDNFQTGKYLLHHTGIYIKTDQPLPPNHATNILKEREAVWLLWQPESPLKWENHVADLQTRLHDPRIDLDGITVHVYLEEGPCVDGFLLALKKIKTELIYKAGRYP